jgi:HAMP domain-containing protein
MRPTLKLKIVSGIAVVALAAVAVGLFGSHLVGQVRDQSSQSAAESQHQMAFVATIQGEVLDAQLYAMLLEFGPGSYKGVMLPLTLSTSRKASEDILALGREHLSPKATEALRELDVPLSTLNKTYNQLLKADLPVPDPTAPIYDAAHDPGSKVGLTLEQTIVGASAKLGQQVAADANLSRQAASARASHSVRLLLWIVAAIGLAGMLFGFWFATRLVRRVKATAQVLERVAEGDLTTRVEVRGRDEISQMATALNTTITTVHDVVSQLESQALELSDFADRSSERTSTTGTDQDSVQLAGMAANLAAMIALFVIEDEETKAPQPVPVG